MNPPCDVPAPAASACCDVPAPAPAAPVRPANPAGLSQVAYRIGTFGTFRLAMVRDLAELLPRWHDGRDHGAALVDLWAYLADVLTFYQERVANEAYLATAVQRDSLARLAELVDYRPSPGAAAAALLAFTVARHAALTVPARLRVASRPAPGRPSAVFETDAAIDARGEHSAIPVATQVPADWFGPVSGTSRAIRFRGANLRLQPGDDLLITESTAAVPALRAITDVRADRAAGTTSVTIAETAGSSYENAAVFVFRTRAAVFGSSAPRWDSLPAYLTQKKVNGFDNVPAFPDSWEGRQLGAVDHVDLDRVVEGITPGWAALVDGASRQVLAVQAVGEVGQADFTLSGRVTRLTFAGAIDGSFTIRGTTVLTRAEQLEPYGLQPATGPVAGDMIQLQGSFPNLAAGQTVVVAGPEGAEGAVVRDATPDAVAGITTVRLRAPLARSYARATAVVHANVAPASQGETVRDEVLGSGDGSAFQSFALRRQPLTYTQSAAADIEVGVSSTLRVTVNGVVWHERRGLTGALASERAFVTSQDDAGRTHVGFGDGAGGARVPTGRDNVHASYRWGEGSAGNVGAGAISQLVDRPAGLQAVTNPRQAAGGADREDAASIRVNAPGSLATLGRAVSVDDYAALALAFPGVRRARAEVLARDGDRPLPRQAVRVTVDADVELAGLRAFLDASRDANVPLRLVQASTIDAALTAVVDVLGDHGQQATLRAARAAVAGQPAPDGGLGLFARLGFGDSVALSAVYAALQGAAGVRDVLVVAFGPAPATGAVRDVIPAGPGELVTLAASDLVVTLGSGGFVDS